MNLHPISRTRLIALALAGALGAAGCSAAAQGLNPREALVNASIDDPLLAWCAGNLLPGVLDAFAVAVRNSGEDGRYLVLGSDGRTNALATFSGSPELACYSTAEAMRRHAAVLSSETVEGAIEPVWSTDVICGFVEETRAICWQYSPTERAFVEVGGWIT